MLEKKQQVCVQAWLHCCSIEVGIEKIKKRASKKINTFQVYVYHRNPAAAKDYVNNV